MAEPRTIKEWLLRMDPGDALTVIGCFAVAVAFIILMIFVPDAGTCSLRINDTPTTTAWSK